MCVNHLSDSQTQTLRLAFFILQSAGWPNHSWHAIKPWLSDHIRSPMSSNLGSHLANGSHNVLNFSTVVWHCGMICGSTKMKDATDSWDSDSQSKYQHGDPPQSWSIILSLLWPATSSPNGIAATWKHCHHWHVLWSRIVPAPHQNASGTTSNRAWIQSCFVAQYCYQWLPDQS